MFICIAGRVITFACVCANFCFQRYNYFIYLNLYRKLIDRPKTQTSMEWWDQHAEHRREWRTEERERKRVCLWEMVRRIDREIALNWINVHTKLIIYFAHRVTTIRLQSMCTVDCIANKIQKVETRTTTIDKQRDKAKRCVPIHEWHNINTMVSIFSLHSPQFFVRMRLSMFTVFSTL